MENIQELLSGIPTWLTAMIVLALGWLAAIVIRVVVTRLLRFFVTTQQASRGGMLAEVKGA
ncbi:MAG: hypothetical protein QME60_07120, partial [Verrucomicrobiota bacterium]|nr:hypothetical protein [Verrucomicrobiota bacterium]